jgi:hypothetical protein
MAPSLSIRAALEDARGRVQYASEESVAQIVQALSRIGFNCDDEDVQGGFQELEGWAVMQPPLNLTLAIAHGAIIVLQAQVCAG